MVIFLRAEEAGYDHGASHIAAKGEGNKDQRDLITVAHSGEGVLTDPFSCNEAVGNVVELLENYGGKEGKAEAPENRGRFSLRQVTIHR